MIGILAGMGPKSTGPFLDQLISHFQMITGAKNDIDFPPMMIYSLPTPFYLDRPIDHTLMEKTICQGLKKLEACGTSFIAMPCNTAHVYFERLQTCIDIPLLNMIDITVKCLPPSVKKLTIFGTSATIDSQIYQKKLQKLKREYLLYPQWQEKIDALITYIKKDPDLKNALLIWETLSKQLHEEGVDAILLVCTDLNLLFEQLTIPFQIIDSSACLAKAIVNTWTARK